jgi:hypothetical protein
MAEKRFLSLSVHGLVDFLLRRRATSIPAIYNQETMQMGTILHAAFQEKQGHEYLSEVALKETFERQRRGDSLSKGGPMASSSAGISRSSTKSKAR